MEQQTTQQFPNSLTDITVGLTTAEVAKAPKNIPTHHVTKFELALTVLKNQLTSFFFILLIISGTLSYFLGETVDSIIFFVIALLNAIIGFTQEFNANQTVQALEKLITHKVYVRRDSQLIEINSEEVVEGDIVVCEPGDVVVADMLVREATDLFIDESVRTGETMPRLVNANEVVFAGGNITQGTLVGQVTSVGKKSSILMYAEKISKITKNNSFDKFIHTVSTYLLGFTVLCLALVFVVNVLIVHSFEFSGFMLYAISMLVGVVPESLPLIITIILSREVVALANHKVIVKKLSVLQNLGSMNYLFTDKTGTMTENNLSVRETIDQNNLRSMLMNIVSSEYERTPMDQVFDRAIEKYLKENASYVQKVEKDKLTFSPFQVKRGYAMYTLPNGDIIIRGQYRTVAEVCNNEGNDFLNECLSLEEQGLRIIALGQKNNNEEKYNLSGVVVFEDPLKADAVETYNKIEAMGVDIKMLTGDSLAVATYIGRTLENDFEKDKVFSMDDMKEGDTPKLVDYEIYARCSPDHKSIIIEEHLNSGVVGFLGDGINDALALKRADIGFVVNNASDVARQASDVILMEKSLNPIVQAVVLSRKAFFHVRTYLLCTLTGNIGTLISLTVVVLFWQEIPMLPIQILLNNLLTDIPLLFLIGDTIARSSIAEPIRVDPRKFFRIIFVFALISSLFDFIFFFTFYHYDISILRTGWFIFSVLCELGLVLALRAELSIFKAPRISKMLLLAIALCTILTVILPFTSFGKIFSLFPLSLTQIGLIVGIILLYITANEIIKRYFFRK